MTLIAIHDAARPLELRFPVPIATRAAIPVVEGCLASHFGDLAYLAHIPDLVYVTTEPPSSLP